MPLYFAYGSNMSPVQMTERCPGALAIGWGRLDGWRFHITTRGCANIVPSPEDCVYGVLWKCTHFHMHHLDDFEGVNRRNYLPRLMLITCHLGRGRQAVTYVSERRYPGQARIDYMRTAVLPGAKAFSLPGHYINELESWLPSYLIAGSKPRYRGRRWTRLCP